MTAMVESRRAGAALAFLGIVLTNPWVPGGYGVPDASGRALLSVDLALSTATTRVVSYGQIGLTLVVHNRTDGEVPFSEEILGQPYGGARLWIEVVRVGEDGGQEVEVFTPEPTHVIGDSSPILVIPVGGEASVQFELGAKLRSRGEGQAELVPAFSTTGTFQVVACYGWNKETWRSNGLVVKVEETGARDAAALKELKDLREVAYWVYEPQLIPYSKTRVELAGIESLAATESEYGEYAKFALAWHFSEQALSADIDPTRFGQAQDIAREFVGKLTRTDLPFESKLASLRKRLASEPR